MRNGSSEVSATISVKYLITYVEDDTKYWTKGRSYNAKQISDNTWEIETNLGTIGHVGDPYMLDNFNEYFRKET